MGGRVLEASASAGGALSRGVGTLTKELRGAAAAAGVGVGARAEAAGGGASSAQRLEAQLRALHADDALLSRDPADGAAFEAWCGRFELLAQTSTIEALLKEYDELRATHARLVPAAVPYRTFWQRYFYQREAIEAQEKRRVALLRRAAAPAPAQSLSWGNDDDAFEFLNSGGAPPKRTAPRSPPKLSLIHI